MQVWGLFFAIVGAFAINVNNAAQNALEHQQTPYTGGACPTLAGWTPIFHCNGLASSASYDLDFNSIYLMANQATQIRIVSCNGAFDATSIPNTYPIQRLRQNQTISFPLSGYATAAVVSQAWTGSAATLATLWNSCGAVAPINGALFWACNDEGGLHLFTSASSGGLLCTWDYQDRANANNLANGPIAVYLNTVIPPTTTTLTSSLSPQVFGLPVTFTATVSNVVGPAGAVIFYDGTTILGTAPVNSGAAIYQTNGLTVGTHSITATYYSAAIAAQSSTSSALSQVVNQAAASCTTPNLSGWTRIFHCNGLTSSAVYDLDANTVYTLANKATQIRIVSCNGLYDATSIRETYPIQRLRQNQTISFPLSGYATSTAVSQAWTGSAATLATLWNSCGAVAPVNGALFWACNDEGGLHLFTSANSGGLLCTWDYQDRANANNLANGEIAVYLNTGCGCA